MSLAAQWRDLQSDLPAGWTTASLRLELRDRGTADRAAALLGPAQPYRAEAAVLRLSVAVDGSAAAPNAVGRLFVRIDEARLGGELRLSGTSTAPGRAERPITSLVASWDAAVAGLPADWSDLYCELQLLSTDYIERAAVLCVQMNPLRDGHRSALRFRVAHTAGYGAAPGMVRRCFERCDAEAIRGSVSVLRSLSDSNLVATQGPVWLLGGRTV
ncbi:MAG: hypothetical protein QOE36_3187 [Gaiellaceae bacterium]|nr:hypothetical protein [Gaiellaceae bacterium]